MVHYTSKQAFSKFGKLVFMAGVAVSLLNCASPDSSSSRTSSGNPEQACLNLAGYTIAASDIALPTTGAQITSTEWVTTETAGNSNGEFCKVLGAIHPVSYSAPDINFEVNLPSGWNGKTLQFGGGGLNGVLVTGLGRYAKQPDSEPTPLAMGYVTLGSDSGHQSAGGFDGNFYLNREALENYGHQQIKKTHDAAMILVQEFYGSAPRYNYFIGGSQGGHEAFDAVQRYPDDYDGAVAGYPAHNVLMLHLSALNVAKALHANEERSWMNPAKAKVLVDAVYARCDGLDNADDGIISNVSACRTKTADFKLLSDDNPVRCVMGADTGDSCLSDEQIQAMNALDVPYETGFPIFRDDQGTAVFPKWTPFEGSTFTDGGLSILGAQGPRQALQFSPGDATTRYAITRNLNMDVLTEFDVKEWAGRVTELAPVLSANSLNLDRFRAKGGKLIYFHGMVDDFITPHSSIQYWQHLTNHYGDVSDFVRFYTIPGMGHVTGVFNARVSTLDALEAWVEEGQAPAELKAIDANAGSNGRTRPVCHYPLWPRYNGSGNLNEADSFSCVE